MKLKNMKLVLALPVLALQLSTFSTAYAGGMDGGGGDVILCEHVRLEDRLFSGPKVVSRYTEMGLADTFKSLSKLKSIGSDYSQLQRQEILLLMVDELYPEIAPKIRKIVKELQFEFVGKLEELDDDNIALPAPIEEQLRSVQCRKSQLAIQDVSKKTVRVHYKYYNELSTWEKDLLVIHEAFINLYYPVRDTTPIRALVKKISSSYELREKAELSSRRLEGHFYSDREKVMLLASVLRDMMINTPSLSRLPAPVNSFQGCLLEDQNAIITPDTDIAGMEFGHWKWENRVSGGESATYAVANILCYVLLKENFAKQLQRKIPGISINDPEFFTEAFYTLPSEVFKEEMKKNNWQSVKKDKDLRYAALYHMTNGDGFSTPMLKKHDTLGSALFEIVISDKLGFPTKK